MVFCCKWINNHGNQPQLFILLLLLSIAQLTVLIEGRTGHMLLQVAKEEGGGELMGRSLIGSRPPRCDKRCIACGHCEAVQVPVAPQNKNGIVVSHFPTVSYRGDEGSSNYKPLGWRCKCGDVIYNPEASDGGNN